MLQAAAEHLQSLPSRSSEILVVDDGSRDNTAAVVLAMPATHSVCDVQVRNFDLRVISLSRNRGKGAAVKHGFLHARGRRLLMVDADGASQFSDIELLWKALDKIDAAGHGVAIGSRAHLVDTEAVVKARNVGLLSVQIRLTSSRSARSFGIC
jgi:dolichyl-phosphate beta-glucosyltransferase